MEIARDLIGKFVRVEFKDHFRFDKIDKNELLLNLHKYSKNSAVGTVLDVTDDFLVVVNSWGESHDRLAGMAILKSSISMISNLEGTAKKQDR